MKRIYHQFIKRLRSMYPQIPKGAKIIPSKRNNWTWELEGSDAYLPFPLGGFTPVEELIQVIALETYRIRKTSYLTVWEAEKMPQWARYHPDDSKLWEVQRALIKEERPENLESFVQKFGYKNLEEYQTEKESNLKYLLRIPDEMSLEEYLKINLD